MDIQIIQKEILKIRQQSKHLIAVSNSEWYSLFKEEIRNSIAIEGVFTNRNDLLNVLERNKRTNDQKTAAILGYFDAASTLYEYAGNLFKTGEFSLRVSDIKQIHALLMRYEAQIGTFNGELGEFRKEDVAVTQSSFTPLRALFLEKTIRTFVDWINSQLVTSEINAIRFVAASHVLFETIHPFVDGNGRVGRILLNFLLIGMGLVNISIKGTTRQDREKYYDALDRADGGFNQMLREIEAGKLPTPALINKYATASQLEWMEKMIWERLWFAVNNLRSAKPSQYKIDALLPLREIARQFNFSQDYLRNLINKGKLKGQKQGKLWYVRIRDIECYLHEVEERNNSRRT